MKIIYKYCYFFYFSINNILLYLTYHIKLDSALYN